MHEVATQSRHVQPVRDSRQHRSQEQRHRGAIRSCAPRPQESDGPRRGPQQGKPQGVGAEKIHRIPPSLRPVGGARFLGQRRVRHERREVAHAEHLVAHRESGGDESEPRPLPPGGPTPGRARADPQCGTEPQTEKSEIGSDERPAADDEGRREGAARRHGTSACEQPEHPAQPADHEAGLETGGREIPHGGDGREHGGAQRKPERPVSGVAPGSVRVAEQTHCESRGTRLSQEEPHDREQQAEDHGADLERSTQASPGREERHPERARVRLDALSDVEDGSVAREEVPDDPQIDEGIIVHPAPGISHARENDHGEYRRDAAGHPRNMVRSRVPS